MSEANAHRGEIEIDLGAAGKFALRPDFEAVAAIDAQLGGIIAVAKRTFETNGVGLTLNEMAVIVAEGMKGQARKEGRTAAAKVEKVAEMIFTAGITNAIGPCMVVLSNAVMGGATPDPADAGND
jgi:hypothetical protein